MKSVVIGANGFMGRAIVRQLLACRCDVYSYDINGDDPIEGLIQGGDVRDRDRCDLMVEGADEVYNLAGVLGTSELNETISQAIKTNVGGSVNVFQACMDAGVKRVFYPVKPNPWRNTYTITKEAAEEFALMFHEQGPTEFCLHRWFNAYGPEQHTHPVRKIIPTFMLLARFQLPIQIFGTGQNVVDMIYSEDLARAAVWAMHNGYHMGEPKDFGAGLPRTVLEVARAVIEVTGSKSGIEHVPMREGETEGTVLVADMEWARRKGWYWSRWMDTLAITWKYYSNIPAEEAIGALKALKLWR